jgi:hypothetical protein
MLKFFREAFLNTIQDTIYWCPKLPCMLFPGWWENVKALTFHCTFRTASKQKPRYCTKIRYVTTSCM